MVLVMSQAKDGTHPHFHARIFRRGKQQGQELILLRPGLCQTDSIQAIESIHRHNGEKPVLFLLQRTATNLGGMVTLAFWSANRLHATA